MLNTSCTLLVNRPKPALSNLTQTKLLEKKRFLSPYDIVAVHMNSAFAQTTIEGQSRCIKSQEKEWVSSLAPKVRSVQLKSRQEYPIALVEASLAGKKVQDEELRGRILRGKKIMTEIKEEAREEEVKVRNYAKLKSIDFDYIEASKKDFLPYLRHSAVEKNKKCLKSFLRMNKERHYRRLQSLRKISGVHEGVGESMADGKLLCLMRVGMALPQRRA